MSYIFVMCRWFSHQSSLKLKKQHDPAATGGVVSHQAAFLQTDSQLYFEAAQYEPTGAISSHGAQASVGHDAEEDQRQHVPPPPGGLPLAQNKNEESSSSWSWA